MDDSNIWFLMDSWLNTVYDLVCCSTWVCFTCTCSFLQIPGPVRCISTKLSIIQICLRDFVSIFLLLGIPPFFIWWWYDDIVSNVSIFLLKFWSMISFSCRTDFVKSVFFCVGRLRFVLIDSTKVVLVFSSSWIVSCLFCISDGRSEFFFSRKTNVFPPLNF